MTDGLGGRTNVGRRTPAAGRVRTGARAPNYFNGRLLSAGDLQAERDAGRELIGRVGRAVGAGVAYGLELNVVPARAGSLRTIVRVRAGLAVGPYGDLLQLDTDTDLNVISAAAPAPVAVVGAAGFRRCQPPAVGPTEVTNAGLHILAVGPTGESSGLVATSALGSAAGACAVREDVTGVRFVLLPFNLALEKSLRVDASMPGVTRASGRGSAAGRRGPASGPGRRSRPRRAWGPTRPHRSGRSQPSPTRRSRRATSRWRC